MNTSLPATPNNTLGWPATCTNALADAVCSAQCKPGYVGTVNTTCGFDGLWSQNTTGECVNTTGMQRLPATGLVVCQGYTRAQHGCQTSEIRGAF
jgi:hypothetical protein